MIRQLYRELVAGQRMGLGREMSDRSADKGGLDNSLLFGFDSWLESVNSYQLNSISRLDFVH